MPEPLLSYGEFPMINDGAPIPAVCYDEEECEYEVFVEELFDNSNSNGKYYRVRSHALNGLHP